MGADASTNTDADTDTDADADADTAPNDADTNAAPNVRAIARPHSTAHAVANPDAYIRAACTPIEVCHQCRHRERLRDTAGARNSKAADERCRAEK